MAFKSQPTATSPPVLLGTPTSLLAAGGEQNQPPATSTTAPLSTAPRQRERPGIFRARAASDRWLTLQLSGPVHTGRI